MQLSSALLVVGAGLASAHYKLDYPEWRDVTLSPVNPDYSQWTYPCAGVPPNAGNRTEWPIDGGSLVLGLNHKWTYIFVNLGMGNNVSTFNMSLTTPFWNSTGNGTLCIPKMTLPTTLDISDGDEASIQVVTVNDRGGALYNCADIKFSADAKALSDDECVTDGVTFTEVLTPESAASTDGSEDSTGGSTESGNEGTSAAGALNMNLMATTSFAALAMAMVYGVAL